MIKALRQKAGLTQKELSEKTNIDCATISLYEKRKRLPTMTNIKIIAIALKTPAVDLVKYYYGI